MLHYMEGFYPNVEQEGSHKQALVDFIMSQEWERIGEEHFFFNLFCCQEEKTFSHFLQLWKQKGDPIYNVNL